jgi:hypothetical protein
MICLGIKPVPRGSLPSPVGSQELRRLLLPAALVCVPEGENEVDRLRGLWVMATCNPMGAGRWREEYNRHLQGKGVGILPDNDEPGRAQAQKVARTLHGIATSIKIVELPAMILDFCTSLIMIKSGCTSGSASLPCLPTSCPNWQTERRKLARARITGVVCPESPKITPFAANRDKKTRLHRFGGPKSWTDWQF